MNGKKIAAAVAGGVAVVGATVGITLATTSSPPAPKVAVPACQADPSAAINATPSGGTWTGVGCYTVPNGVRLTASNITIDGGTFIDPTSVKPAKGGFQPIFRVQSVSGDTLTNVAVQGANTAGKYTPSLVGEAGFKLIATSGITLNNDTASNTYGSCLEIFAEPPKVTTPNTALTVNTFHGANCGRDGIDPSDVVNSTFNGLTFGETGQVDIDFESDLNSLGAGNITFNHCVLQGFIVGEKLTGPINVNTTSITGQILVRHKVFQPSPVTFTGGSFAAVAKASVAGISLSRGVLVFQNELLTRLPTNGAPKAPAYKVINGGQLTFINSPITPPTGTADSTSKVIS